MEDGEEDSDDFLGSLKVHNEGDKAGVIWLKPVIEGKGLEMELDKSSVLSVIPLDQYKEYFGDLKIEKSNVILKTHTGEKNYEM